MAPWTGGCYWSPSPPPPPPPTNESLREYVQKYMEQAEHQCFFAAYVMPRFVKANEMVGAWLVTRLVDQQLGIPSMMNTVPCDYELDIARTLNQHVECVQTTIAFCQGLTSFCRIITLSLPPTASTYGTMQLSTARSAPPLELEVFVKTSGGDAVLREAVFASGAVRRELLMNTKVFPLFFGGTCYGRNVVARISNDAERTVRFHVPRLLCADVDEYGREMTFIFERVFASRHSALVTWWTFGDLRKIISDCSPRTTRHALAVLALRELASFHLSSKLALNNNNKNNTNRNNTNNNDDNLRRALV